MVFTFRGEGIGRTGLESSVSNFYSGGFAYDSEDSAYAREGVLSRVFNGLKRRGALGLVGLAALVGVEGCEGGNQNTRNGSAIQAAGVAVAKKNPLAGAVMNIVGGNIANQGAHEAGRNVDTVERTTKDANPFYGMLYIYYKISDGWATDINNDGFLTGEEVCEKEIFRYGEKINIIYGGQTKGNIAKIGMVVRDKDGNILNVAQTKVHDKFIWQNPFTAQKKDKGIEEFLITFEWNDRKLSLGRFFVDYSNKDINQKN